MKNSKILLAVTQSAERISEEDTRWSKARCSTHEMLYQPTVYLVTISFAASGLNTHAQ